MMVFMILVVLMQTLFAGEFIDPRDGTTYKTVQIGSQEWMAENLRYLPKVNGKTEFDAYAYHVYDNRLPIVWLAKKTKSYKKYGVLYNWYVAMESCPQGWHLPDTNEWKSLFAAVGGKDVAGKKLKSSYGWFKNGNGTDEYGFSVLPAGFINNLDFFMARNEYSAFWISANTEERKSIYTVFYFPYDKVIYSPTSGLIDQTLYKSSGLSVRCVRD